MVYLFMDISLIWHMISMGLQIIDISYPRNSVEVSYLNTSGYSLNVFVTANYTYVADGPGKLRIVNFLDPYNPRES